MQLDDLTKLYILQKETHKYPNSLEAQQAFKHYYDRLMAPWEIERTDVLAPPIGPMQVAIPFALLKPKHKHATESNLRPLIIHTHGGPNVYLDKNTLHAEIAYFLSQGYVVACPNYRGSTRNPFATNSASNLPRWEDWIALSKDKHRIYGPADVYLVAKYMQNQPYVDKSKIFLRGGSFGSYINSHLLVDINNGEYQNLFAGVHLSGGVKYPVPSAMPDTIPILITHGQWDDVAPVDSARLFMEQLLLRQESRKLANNPTASVTTFIAHRGNHHLIDSMLQISDRSSTSEYKKSYKELEEYLALSTGFIDGLCQDQPIPPSNYLEFVQEHTSPCDALDGEKKSRLPVLKQSMLSRQQTPPYVALYCNTPNPVPAKPFYSPTKALLKIHLGPHYTGNTETDFDAYLKDHFQPIDWSNDHNKISNAGNMLGLSRLKSHFTHMIDNEERFLKANPNYIVLYHCADNTTLQLYSFINLWKGILQGKILRTLPVIEEMRLFDFMKKSFTNVSTFLTKMRQLKPSDDPFNYTLGFSNRAIACNPSLISNAHNTASCSLWWYYKATNINTNLNMTPIDAIISDMLQLVLGPDSRDQFQRYRDLFENHNQYLAFESQALMQQIFIPYDEAKKSVYLCQLWGEEFKDNPIDLQSPSQIQDLIGAPEDYERKLRQHRAAFENHGKCEGFGDVEIGFNFADALQMRYLPRDTENTVTYSYFRNPRLHQNLVRDLSLLIQEDFVAYLGTENQIPDYIVPKASVAKMSFFSQGSSSRSTTNMQHPNFHAVYLQQRELYQGLVENPDKEIYGGVQEFHLGGKYRLQKKIRDAKIQKNFQPHVYGLCLYLKGYTYYDLLIEAIDGHFLNNNIMNAHKEKSKEQADFLKQMIDRFCVAKDINEQPFSLEDYESFHTELETCFSFLKYNRQAHEFFKREGAIWKEEITFQFECDSAKNSVYRILDQAKENFLKHEQDTSSDKIMAL